MKHIALSFIVLVTFWTVAFQGTGKPSGPGPGSLLQGEWKQVRTSQSNGYYHALCFADQSSGWVVGDSGRILSTTDGGNSWQLQNTGTTASLTCVFFANRRDGWVAGSDNLIGISSDGGLSWTWQHPAGESRRTFMAMSFVNEHEGWVVDNCSGILHTKDGGISWTRQMSGTRWAITSVQFLNPQEGWATATNRVILHTTDGGNNWMTMPLDMRDCARYFTLVCTDIFMRNSSNGWVATDASASNYYPSYASIFRTSDAGGTWTCRPAPGVISIRSLKFVDDSVGWAAAWRGILHTTDRGQTWAYQLEIDDGIVDAIWFVDQSHGWALTFTGNIFRYQAL